LTEQKQSCEGGISLKEYELILIAFQDNKSFGTDGIPIEFYLVKDCCTNCVNESFKYGEMSNSQKRAIITLTV